jgi:hypothetical protein
VGALFRGVKRIHINRVCFNITPPSLRNRDKLVNWVVYAGQLNSFTGQLSSLCWSTE